MKSPPLSNRRTYFFATVFALLSASLGLFFFLTRGSGDSFPFMEQGAYVGTISGFRNNDPGSSAVLYVERLAHGNAALIVAMIEGQEPQLVSLKQINSGSSKVLDPIRFKLFERDVELIGASRFGRLSGEIRGATGRWELRRTSTEDLVEGIDELKATSAEVDRWLGARSKFLELDHGYSRLMANLTDAQEKTTKLQNLLDQQDMLRSRADARKQTLKKEIQQIGTEQHSKEENLQNLVSELDLLTRITKRGKAISLARKVANRENAWYLANWRTADDSAGLDEFLVGAEAVDLASVERELVKAKEKESLLRELNNERRHVAELQARLRQPNSRDSKPEIENQNERVVPQKPTEPRRGFWDRIFG